MKITKKQPLRPRGRSEEKRQSTKNAIRDAYINGPQKEVQIIPAKGIWKRKPKRKNFVCVRTAVSARMRTLRQAVTSFKFKTIPV